MMMVKVAMMRNLDMLNERRLRHGLSKISTRATDPAETREADRVIMFCRLGTTSL